MAYSYSREETIAALRDYYAFLTKLYLPTSAIVYPPESGWPNITADRLPGKTEEMVQLLRRLPYILEQDDPDDRGRGAPRTHFADYHSDQLLDTLTGDPDFRILTEGPQFEPVRPYVIGLTFGHPYRTVFFLDTKHGVIYWIVCPDDRDWKPGPSKKKVFVWHDDSDNNSEQGNKESDEENKTTKRK